MNKIHSNNLHDDDIAAFAAFFYKGVRKFGLVKVRKKLQELYLQKIPLKERYVKEQIFEEVAQQYGTSPAEIIQSSKRGKITQAKAITMLLLYAHVNISQSEIATLFGRGQSLVSKRIKSFLKTINGCADSTGKMFTQKFITDYNSINQKINDFKNGKRN